MARSPRRGRGSGSPCSAPSVAGRVAGRAWRAARERGGGEGHARGFAPRLLDSTSRVLAVAPRGHVCLRLHIDTSLPAMGGRRGVGRRAGGWVGRGGRAFRQRPKEGPASRWTRACARARACVCERERERERVSARERACVCVCVRACTHARVCACARVRARACVCACVCVRARKCVRV